jgi:glycosidase
LLRFTKEAIRLRRRHPALRVGAYHRLIGGTSIYAFARSLPATDPATSTVLVVAVNVDTAPQIVTIPLHGLPVRHTAPEVCFGEVEVLASSRAELIVRLPARGGAVLEL